jgi:hypothetical protein
MTEEPVRVFNQAFDLIAAEQWLELAALCDPLSLRVFREQYLRNINTRTSAHSAEDLMKHSPDMPREVAEYYARQANQYAGAEERFRADFPTIESLSQLLALAPVELFAAWLLGSSPRVQLDLHLKDGRLPPRAVDRIREGLGDQSPKPVVLGSIADGLDFVHVVYRSPLSEREPSNALSEEEFFNETVRPRRFVQVETLRRGTDNRWYLIADHHLLGLGHSMFFVEADEGHEV